MSMDTAVAGRGPINQLVLSYLSHHGYAKTTWAFQAQCEKRAGVVRDGYGLVVPSRPAPVSLPTNDATATPAFDGLGPGMHHEDIELHTRIANSVMKGTSTERLQRPRGTTRKCSNGRSEAG